MLKRAILNIAKRIVGKNVVLRKVLIREYESRRYIKAVAMMLYLLPMKGALAKAITPLNRCNVVTSAEYYNELWKLLHISKVEDRELIRLGRDNDGGYIMLNDFDSDDKIAYSFGISRDVSWDKAMALRGYDVFMYDHTIEGLPEENSRFHWFRQGISDGSCDDERLRTLEYFIEHNHHEGKKDMILKMDVEGAEWGFLENLETETLKQFSQVLLEFHGIVNPKTFKRIPNALRKLNQTHQLIHLHGQNIGPYVSTGGKIFCNQIEVSYVRRDKYTFIDEYDVNLPIDIDMPAAWFNDEIELGRWNNEFKADDNHVSIIIVQLHY